MWPRIRDQEIRNFKASGAGGKENVVPPAARSRARFRYGSTSSIGIGAALITVVSYRVLLVVIAVVAAASGLFVVGQRGGVMVLAGGCLRGGRGAVQRLPVPHQSPAERRGGGAVDDEWDDAENELGPAGDL